MSQGANQAKKEIPVSNNAGQETAVIATLVVGFILFKVVTKVLKGKQEEMEAKQAAAGPSWGQVSQGMQQEGAKNHMRMLMQNARPPPHLRATHLPKEMECNMNGYVGEDALTTAQGKHSLHVLHTSPEFWVKTCNGLPKSVQKYIATQLPGEFDEVLTELDNQKKAFLRKLMKECKRAEDVSEEDSLKDMEVSTEGIFVDGSEHVTEIPMECYKKGGVSKSVRKYIARELPENEFSTLLKEERAENEEDDKNAPEKPQGGGCCGGC